MERNGGQEDGRGSTRAAGLPAEAARALAPFAAPAPRVLVVEDHPDSREMLAELLRLWGHEVRTAQDGPQGLCAALAWAPDVAVLDIGLPGLDGFELVRRLRSALGGTVRLVALTAYGGAADRARGREAGFDAYLAKPANLGLLARAPRPG